MTRHREKRRGGRGKMDDGTVVGRALEILEAVSSSGSQISLALLATSTGIPKPTVRRIAEDLVQRRLLLRSGAGYALGPALAALGRAALIQERLVVVVDALTHLQDRCGGLVWATVDPSATQPTTVLADPRLRQLARAQWRDLTQPSALVNTAGGRLILARRPDLLEDIARGEMPMMTRNSPATLIQLQGILHEVRAQGAAIEVESAQAGWRCVALEIEWPMPAIVGITTHTGAGAVSQLLRAATEAIDELQRARPSLAARN